MTLDDFKFSCVVVLVLLLSVWYAWPTPHEKTYTHSELAAICAEAKEK